MKMDVTKLSGAALDWAVGVCERVDPLYADAIHPSTSWAHGGPIVDKQGIDLTYLPGDHPKWHAKQTWNKGSDPGTYGPTALTAAMRCYVLAEMGLVIDVPDRLVNENQDLCDGVTDIGKTFSTVNEDLLDEFSSDNDVFVKFELRPVVFDENETATPFITHSEAEEYAEECQENGFGQILFGLYGRTANAIGDDALGFQHIADRVTKEGARELVHNLFGKTIGQDWNGDRIEFESPMFAKQQTVEVDNLNIGTTPRILMTVSGGVGDYIADAGVQAELFDFDNYHADPENTPKVSVLFADLAVEMNAPVEDIAGLSVDHPDKGMPHSYVGKIVEGGENYVVQSIGRNKGLIHLTRDLDRVPGKDEMVEIRYENGRGTVKGEKALGKGVER
jgi:hypothetical protein